MWLSGRMRQNFALGGLVICIRRLRPIEICGFRSARERRFFF